MTKGCVTPKKNPAAPRMDLILSWPKPSRFFNASTQTLLGFVHRRFEMVKYKTGSYERFTAVIWTWKIQDGSTNRWLDFFRQMMSDRYNSVLGADSQRRMNGGYPTSWRVRIPSRPSNIGIHPDRIQVDITPQELLYHLIASKDDFLGYCS